MIEGEELESRWSRSASPELRASHAAAVSETNLLTLTILRIKGGADDVHHITTHLAT
jgi:hypothetical protein